MVAQSQNSYCKVKLKPHRILKDALLRDTYNNEDRKHNMKKLDSALAKFCRSIAEALHLVSNVQSQSISCYKING